LKEELDGKPTHNLFYEVEQEKGKKQWVKERKSDFRVLMKVTNVSFIIERAKEAASIANKRNQ